MKITKTIGYCPICGPIYGKKTYQNKQKLDVTKFKCETHQVFLQPEKPKNDPSRVALLLPFLKLKEKVTKTVTNIRNVAFEKNVEIYRKTLKGKRIRESARDTYARVLATVSKEKRVTTKNLSLILGRTASQASAWLERLRALQLVVREKRPGPARMVWHYSLA
jgi:hypothetical protein